MQKVPNNNNRNKMQSKVPLLCLVLTFLFHISGVISSAAAVGPEHQRFQFEHIDLSEYDLYDLARLVYKTEPDVVEEVLRSLLEDEAEVDLVVKDLRGPIFDLDVPCLLCKRMVIPLKLAAVQGQATFNVTMEKWISACENITIPLGMRGEILCRGTLGLQMPYVYKVLIKPNSTVDRMCEFLNLCFPDFLPQSLNNKKSETTPRSKPPVPQRLHKGEGKAGLSSRSSAPENSIVVVQLTDIHIEPEYTVRTSTDCGLPVCCVKEYGEGDAGKYGDYRCNIPRTTAQMFIQKAVSFNPEVILFSGDVPPHSMWDESEESQMECSKILVEVLNETLPEASRRVYPNIGNHEGYPTNLFSVRSLEYTPRFLDSWADLWQPLANFTATERDWIDQGGFYSKVVYENLLLISFNTNYMYTFNWYNTDNHLGTRLNPVSEYEAMINFVEEQLDLANISNQKVILMGHHPPGGQDYLVNGSRWYRDLVLRYADIIVLQPTGHTHYDEFRMIYDEEGVPRSVVLVAPCMSSNGARNPSMRVFYLDRDTKELLDYDHYYLNIGPVLRDEELPPDWTQLIELLYNAKKEYGLEDLSPASWDDLLNRFETDSDLLLKHRQNSQAKGNGESSICLDFCQSKHICRQRHVNFDEYKNCTQSFTRQPRTTLPSAVPPSSNLAISQSSSAVSLICIILSACILVIASFI